MLISNYRRTLKTLGVAGFCGMSVGACLWLGLSVARAQFVRPVPAQPAQPDAKPVASEDIQDNISGVYVRASTIAEGKMTQAQRMQGLKEWNKSADIYQEILEKYPDRVVPCGTDANNRIYQYRSVTEQVRQEICKWPPEGLEVYRGRYETTAAELLKSAAPGDLTNLHKILSLYFATDTAKVAALRLMDVYFELGDYAAVQQIGLRLLGHPNLIVERPSVLFRTALAAQLNENGDAAQKMLAELKTSPNAIGQVRGGDVKLAEELEKQLLNNVHVTHIAAGDSWPMVGGDPSRSRMLAGDSKPGAKLYSIELIHPNRTGAALQAEQARHESGEVLGIMPVVDRGELFFQDNSHIYAVTLESGTALPGWLATYPNGVYKQPHGAAQVDLSNQQMCVTVTDQNVVALMNLPNANSQDANGGIYRFGRPVRGVAAEPTRLVCLDRASGKELWNISPRDLPEKYSILRELDLGGSPLVVGDSVYVVGHGIKGGAQFEDCYVFCYSMRDGSLRWVSYVASSALTNPVDRFNGTPASRLSLSHMAYAGGSLFVSTELGASASLDAFSGSSLWLDIYREEAPPAYNPYGGGMMAMGGTPLGQASAGPFLTNPVIVQDNHVFAMPSDGKGLYIYDAAGGQMIKKITTRDFDSEAIASNLPEMLLGVIDDNVMVSSTSRLFHIPWKTFTHFDKPPAEGEYWGTADYSADRNDLRGRPFITTTKAYVPTITSLIPVSVPKGGMREESFPKHGWDPAEQGPGNVLVTQDHVIIAGDRRIDVYTDLQMAMRKLDQAVANAPTDPTPHLNYAEVMFAAGQLEAAKTQLSKAMELQGGVAAMRPGTVRSHTFTDAMTFATRLITLGKDKPDLAQITWFFEQAAHAAQTATQNATYRWAWAECARNHGDLDKVLELDQAILGDDQMRVAALYDAKTQGTAQAGVLAEKAIKDIMEMPQGKAAYDKYEQAAAAKLTQAHTANDAAAMLAIARGYPNATACHDALIAAATLYENNNDPRNALKVLRQVLLRYPKSEQMFALQAMTRSYLKLPNGLDAAMAKLSQATLSSPIAGDTQISQAFALPDGTQIAKGSTLKTAQAQLLAYAAKQKVTAMPDLNLPSREETANYSKIRQPTQPPMPLPFLPETPATVINNIDALISPVPEFDRHDRFVTFANNGGLAVYQPRKAGPLFAWPQITKKPAGCAWLGDNLVVWSPERVAMVDSTTGKTRWDTPTTSLQSSDVVAYHDDNTPLPQPKLTGAEEAAARAEANRLAMQQVVVNKARVGMVVAVPVVNVGGGVDGGGGAAAVDPAAAQPADHAGETIDKVVVLGQSIILTTNTGRVMALEASNGSVIWQTRVAAHQIDRLLANDDFVVLLVKGEESGSIIAMNTDTGDLIGRQKFSPNDQNKVVNLTLSRDGSLVYVTPTQLCIVDLFDAHRNDDGLAIRASTPAPPPPNPNNPVPVSTPFASCTGPDELLVYQGRVFVVSDGGSQVRTFSLDKAKPWDYTGGARPDTTMIPMLATGTAGETSVHLSIAGSYLYIQSQKAFMAYNLQDPGLKWSRGAQQQTLNLAGMVCGKNHVLLLDKPVVRMAQPDEANAGLTLMCCNRSTLAGGAGPEREMGLLQFNFNLNGAVDNVVAIDGGIVYRTQDGQVHTLLGSGGTLVPK